MTENTSTTANATNAIGIERNCLRRTSVRMSTGCSFVRHGSPQARNCSRRFGPSNTSYGAISSSRSSGMGFKAICRIRRLRGQQFNYLIVIRGGRTVHAHLGFDSFEGLPAGEHDPDVGTRKFDAAYEEVCKRLQWTNENTCAWSRAGSTKHLPSGYPTGDPARGLRRIDCDLYAST